MIGRTQGSALEEERNFPQKLSLTGPASPAPAPLREYGFPPCIQAPFSAFDSDQVLKQHGRYKAAKSGDSDAAIALVYALAVPLFRQFSDAVERGDIPADHIVVAPHAREATGDNAIPQVLAALFRSAEATSTMRSYKRPRCITRALIQWRGSMPEHRSTAESNAEGTTC
ncbi:hypothetical protein [Paraburkholderia bannensis]|uniref:hypothetical protein n=1 Tax=Paraburkholderia bannensis TaxID=765414 RepID=UPI002AB1B592|nr:hypothetical protein [Paraburkholderia bannensis]